MHPLLKILMYYTVCCSLSYTNNAEARLQSSHTAQVTENSKEEDAELKAFVEATANNAIKMIADPKKNDAQIKLEFKKIVAEKFDMEKICSSILGSNRKILKSLDENENNVKAWRNAHSGQGYYASFVSLATNMLIKLYCSKFKDYKDSELKVTEVTQKGIGNKFWDVASTLVLSKEKPPIKVVWTIRCNSKNQLKVFDAKVENISMKTTLKDSISGMISKNKTLQTFMEAFWKEYHQL